MAKIPGAALEFSDERIDALMREYDRYIHFCDQINMPEVFRHIVSRPCSRFWVTPTRAAVIVAKIERGDPLPRMRPCKKKMFIEIHRRVSALREARPCWSYPRLIAEVVSSPAPEFYISPAYARIIVYKHKKAWYEKKRRRTLRPNALLSRSQS